jgi:hypothetical protein
MFVAVASSGTNRVMTSNDNGITWIARAAPEPNNWHSVTYGNGMFVAVANSGTNRVMTSIDNGASWTARAASDEASNWGGLVPAPLALSGSIPVPFTRSGWTSRALLHKAARETAAKTKMRGWVLGALIHSASSCQGRTPHQDRDWSYAGSPEVPLHEDLSAAWVVRCGFRLAPRLTAAGSGWLARNCAKGGMAFFWFRSGCQDLIATKFRISGALDF